MNDVNPEFIKAFVAFQAELPTVRKSATNPHFKSKFAPLDEVNPAVLAVLSKHGLAWATLPCVLADGSPGLRYMLMHEAGGVLSGEMPLLKAGTPQEQGSAITYARRYSIQAVTGVVTDEDDDGQAASRPKQQRSAPAKTEADVSATAKQQLWQFAQTLGMSAEKLANEYTGFAGGTLKEADDSQVLAFLAWLKQDTGAAA